MTEDPAWKKKKKKKRREAYRIVCVKLYLIEQRQTAGYPVLQFDNGDEVAVLSFILACVAQRQRVVLSEKKHRETERGISFNRDQKYWNATGCPQREHFLSFHLNISIL